MPARDELAVSIAWQRHVDRDVGPGSVLERVVNRHREPWRVYHGVGHLIRVVQAIDVVLDDAGRPEVDDHGAIVAAAVFHDAVYQPARADNEAASARLAARELEALPDWPTARCARVAAMIERTADHRGDDIDTAVLIAADLSILAATPARYAEYCAGVRREHAHLDDAAWASGRAAVLRGLLERPAIFPAMLGLAADEHRARANISAEIASLRAGGSAPA